LSQDIQIYLVGPPVAVFGPATSNLFQLSSDERALARGTWMVHCCIMKRVIFHDGAFYFVYNIKCIEVFAIDFIDSFDEVIEKINIYTPDWRVSLTRCHGFKRYQERFFLLAL
jgi:hypothetical protein